MGLSWTNTTVDEFAALSTDEWAALPLAQEQNHSGGSRSMLQGTYALIVSAAGISIQSNVTRTASLGIEPVGSSPEGYASSLKSDTERYSRAVKISGAKAE